MLHQARQVTLDLSQIRIEPLSREGFFVLVDWAKQEGWNPGTHDAEAFWAQDPEGFVGVKHHDALIAGGSIVSYDGDFGFMGFFMVKPEYRGQGLGRKLWTHRRDALKARLNPDASIAMDGVVAMQPFYASGGFVHQFADVRYALKGRPYAVNKHILSGIQDEEALRAYDKTCFLVDRTRFLQHWWNQPDGHVFCWLQDDSIQGYATLRDATEGRRIGPLFADTPEIAEALVKACLNAAGDDTVFLDVPVANPSSVALATMLGGDAVFECARMVLGPVPPWPLDRIYGIASFELG